MAWFKDWFDTPYYHLLYGERNDSEAHAFLDALLLKLCPDKKSEFLDLACGKGRHAAYLASLGYSVHGVDLSPCNIQEAGKRTASQLRFSVHDMRQPFRQGYFDYILNLFTSFGYFDQPGDNLQTLHAVVTDLKPDGVFVQDYLNPSFVIRNLLAEEKKVCGGIAFTIRKTINGQFIEKHITFSDKGKNFEFLERVSLFTPQDFRAMYAKAGLEIVAEYGNYRLDPMNVEKAERQIYICRKKL